MLGSADKLGWVRADEAIFQQIETDPLNIANAKLLLSFLSDYRRPKRDPYARYDLPNLVPTASYREIVNQLLEAGTGEERQRLLAGTVPILSGFEETMWHQKPLIWYDVTVGDTYGFHPEKIEKDPFGPYPASVYDCMESTLNRPQFDVGVGIDLGSGPGDTTRILAKHCQKTIALDSFPFWHSVARVRASNEGIANVDYVTADLGNGIPVGDHTVDLVVSNGLTAFIAPEKMPGYISEIARVLRPGGSYFEPEMDKDGYWRKQYLERVQRDPKLMVSHLIGEIVTAPYLINGHYPHSSRTIEDQFRGMGFGIVEYGDVQGGYITGVSTVCFTAPK